ncbi:MAG: ribosome maturation factor RimM [Terracidiphilus sp.]
MTDVQEWVWLARIRRPQGRKGEVLAEILTDFPEKFAERKQLWLLTESALHSTARAAALDSFWLHKGAIVLHFSGIDSISQAETLAGLIVAIPRSERVTLNEDEAYIGDLIGCELIDVAGQSGTDQPQALVGTIEDVDRTAGPVAILIVRNGKEEVLVPFAKSYLQKLDLGAKRVEMALPHGLVDLNQQPKRRSSD